MPAFLAPIGDKLAALFLSPTAPASVWTLGCALVIGGGWLAGRRLSRGRRIRPRVIARALFPAWLTRSASTRADLAFMAFNLFAAGALLGWAIVSAHAVSGAVGSALIAVFGAAPRVLPAWAASALLTLGLFLAYELGYWVDHYLKHHVPILWRFHRTHHTAETLTPMTNFRMHPVDSVVFLNLIALFTGAANGALTWALGGAVPQIAVLGGNVLVLAAAFLLLHLQHTHLWIAFRGALGRVILSPAHHQLHHSQNPAHFNANFGASLAIWDWMFGTLLIPQAERQPLTFGAAEPGEAPHTVAGAILQPFAEAWALVAPLTKAIRTRPRHRSLGGA
jgi:sterol desaturase/sphingolipid hydroxylase (fatty acid hydroxylase superfamily)